MKKIIFMIVTLCTMSGLLGCSNVSETVEGNEETILEEVEEKVDEEPIESSDEEDEYGEETDDNDKSSDENIDDVIDDPDIIDEPTPDLDNPETPVEDQTEEEIVYVLENGEWNLALLKETILNYFSENDYCYSVYGNKGELTDIFYFGKDTSDRVTFTGVVVNEDETQYLVTFRINKAYDDENLTTDDFLESLTGLKIPIYALARTQIAYSSSTATDEQIEEQEDIITTLTANNYISSDTTILTSYQGKQSTAIADATWGRKTYWDQGYLIYDEEDNEMSFVTMTLVASTLLGEGAIENVVANNEYWKVSSISTEEIDNENLVLYEI